MIESDRKMLFTPLTKRPAATTVTVRELIQKVQRGEVRVPRFQRPLRWKSSDVVKLIDSIWRGYPIGSLLFWKREAEEETVTVGGATLHAPAVTDAWWVVDGQQRTTALAAALLELDHAGDRRWDVHFRPNSQAFRPGLPDPSRADTEVPASSLGDIRRLGRWIREHAVDDAVIEALETAQQRLLDYAIPAYIVETADEQALRGVFARANSTGARMRADEVFQALVGASQPDSPGTPDLDVLQQRCDMEGFGTPPRAEILKAVLAMSDQDPTRRLEEIGGASLVSRDAAAAALSRTVEFVVRSCRIPHISLLPYPVVFFILARWFHLHPRPAPETRELLARWVWRGAVTGAHERAAVSRMREQVRDIRADDEQGSLDRLLARVATKAAGPWALERFNLKSARSRIEILALLNQGPRDRLGPVTVAELMSSGRVAREVFRSEERRALDEEGSGRARTAANRVLLGAAHTGLSRELRSWGWKEDGAALRSHLIDELTYRALVEQDVDAFLTRRAAAVRSAVDRLLEERAAWDNPDIRPLEVYFDETDE